MLRIHSFLPFLPFFLSFLFPMAAGDAALGGADSGAGAEPPPPPADDTPDEPADGGEEPVKSDFDLLSEEEPPAEKAKPDDEAQPEEKPEPVAQKKEPEAEKKPEVKVDQKTEEQKRVEEELAAEAAPVKKLRERIATNPEAKAFFDKHPNLKSEMFFNARRSAELSQYKPHFATPNLAAEAAADLQVFDRIEQPWYSDAAESGKQLLETLYDLDIERDDKGNPIIADQQSGQPKFGGRYVKLMTAYREHGLYPLLNTMRDQFAGYSPEDQTRILGEEFDAEQFSNFVRIMQVMLHDKSDKQQKPVSAARERGEISSRLDESKLSPEDRQDLEYGRQNRAQAQTRTSEEAVNFHKAVREELVKESQTVIHERVKSAAQSLPAGTQEAITKDVLAAISGLAKKDVAYQRHINKLQQNYKGDEYKAKLIAAAKAYTQERMIPLIRETVQRFGAVAVGASKEKHDKLQSQSSQKEPRTQGGVAHPTRRDETVMYEKANALYKKIYGRSMKDAEWLDLGEDELATLERQAKQLGR